jgi:hypothetical protein
MSTQVVFEAPETGPNAPAPETPAQPPIPDNLPENVKKSMQDMRAEITRLQQQVKQATPTPPQQPDPAAPAAPTTEQPKPNDQKPEDKAQSQDDAAKKLTESAGFDVAPYQTEYDSTGDVSPESRDKIAEGLKNVLGADARKIVDDFIESKKVVHTNDKSMYMEAAGGEEAYNTMTQWAAQNLPPEQVAAYNRQVTSGDRHATLFAIEGLRSKFEAANGRAPTLVRGTTTPAIGGVQPFRSVAEMTKIMSSPEYKTDPAYRDQVKQRLAVSKF